MRENFTNLSQEILNKIKSANNILLHFHPSPDADSIGSALSMKIALNSLGKPVTVIKGDSVKTDSFKDLPGYDQALDKNWFEINLSDYDLFISLDSASLDQISSLDDVVFPDPLFVIVIDHHASNTKYGQINLVDPGFSSNCELLFNLYKNWQIDISPEIAKNLILGIYTDSGGFRYPPTNSKTFETASEIVKIVPDYNQTISALLDHNSLGRIKYLGLALSKLKLYFSDKVAVAAVTYQDLVENQIDPSDSEKSEVANYLKSINGVEIGINMCEKSINQISISFRCRDSNTRNVADIASKLGGGGHPSAAGTRLNGPIDQALDKLFQAINDTYPDLSDH